MDHDDEQHRDGRLSAIARHQVHDQAIARGMATAMRGVMARIESIERAVALQAIEIERLDRVLIEIMQQPRGASGDVLEQVEQVMQPTMQPGAIDAA